jgi:GNAT superfamily N-acetyltransferase
VSGVCRTGAQSVISPNSIVRKLTTDEDILAARDVMRQLRPGIPDAAYLDTVRRMMRTDGSLQAAVFEGDTVVAVAGYRFMEMLYAGKTLYVDDLNTDASRRSRGHGKVLLDWLKQEAKERQCVQLQLDSGVQREQTHRFYFREGLTINCYHFRIDL